MTNTKQIQKAGDNAQQVQADTIIINNGITEQRAKEIYSEMSKQIISQNTSDSFEIASRRINRLEEELMPKIEAVDQAYKSFSDPSFQVLLKKAQLTAGCTDRNTDYKILSELIIHRIHNSKDIKKKASITKAIEIIDQIDDDSLCGIVLYHSISSFIPISGSIKQGLFALDNLYKKLNPQNLPSDDLWIDNLSVLGAIDIVYFSRRTKFEEMLSNQLNGYVCVGLQKDSEIYSKAIEEIHKNNLDTSILVDHELLDGYVRLAIPNKAEIPNPTILQHSTTNGINNHEPIMLTQNQIECLNKIFDEYTNDDTLLSKVKNNFAELLDNYESIKIVRKWWDTLQTPIRLTSVGRVIAHTTAKSIDKNLPELD